jgi:hypothetical protein
MNAPDDKPKQNPKWTAPCQFCALAESTKEETACLIYQRMVNPETCTPDCKGYRPWKGNA